MSADTTSNLDDLLARLEKNHPAVAQRQLQFEVDDLLGRETKPKQESSRRAGVSDEDEKLWREDPWARELFRRLPPHVDHERAVELARWVEAGIYADYLLATLNPSEAPREYLESLCAISEQGESSFDYLILCNLRLVYFWCRRLVGSMDENWIQDAFQAGCIGLIRGLQGWDYSRGALSTYVSWHIRQQIQRWRMNDFDIIRVPVHVWEGISAGPDAQSAEISRAAQNAFGVKYTADLSAAVLERAHQSLDPGSDNDGGIGRVLHEYSMRQLLAVVLSLLSDREANVLLSRHGVNSTLNEPATLQQIGEQFGVSRERIRQIERDALRKLRENAALWRAWKSIPA